MNIKTRVDAGRPTGPDKIGVQVGKIINRHKVAKHFELSIGEATLGWARRQEVIDAEAALDGLYVIRTSLGAKRMDAPSCVRSHKALSNVERAFRSLKTVDLKVRPSTIDWLTGCARTSCCACWRSMSSGTCARPGAS